MEPHPLTSVLLCFACPKASRFVDFIPNFNQGVSDHQLFVAKGRRDSSVTIWKSGVHYPSPKPQSRLPTSIRILFRKCRRSCGSGTTRKRSRKSSRNGRPDSIVACPASKCVGPFKNVQPGFPKMLGTFQCLREGPCFYEHTQRPKIRENSSGSGDFTAGR